MKVLTKLNFGAFSASKHVNRKRISNSPTLQSCFYSTKSRSTTRGRQLINHNCFKFNSYNIMSNQLDQSGKLAPTTQCKMKKFDGDLISFEKGWPDRRCIANCSVLLQQASRQIMESSEMQASSVFYGKPGGCDEFRDELAKFLSAQYEDTVNSDHLVVTTGATMGLHIIASTLFNSTHPVFIEDPTYYHNVPTLSDDLTHKLIPVTMMHDGIDINKLEKCAEKHSDSVTCERYPWKGLVYLIPINHNPTGITYSKEKMEALINIAVKYNLLLVCDDVYNLLNYDSYPSHRLLHYDKGGHVASIGSFTKYFCPGVRLGWIEAGPAIIHRLNNTGLFRSGGSLNHYMSMLMYEVMKEGHLLEHLNNMRDIYKKKRDIMVETLSTHLPSSCSHTCPKGGYFVWIELPDTVDTLDFLPFATDYFGVKFMHGVRCSVTENFKNCMRICFVERTHEEIKTGLIRLCDAIKAYTDQDSIEVTNESV